MEQNVFIVHLIFNFLSTTFSMYIYSVSFFTCHLAGDVSLLICAVFSMCISFPMRQAGTQGPKLQCCTPCTWTHPSSSNNIQRHCMGLKITAPMRSWGKFWTPKIQTKNPTATFEEPGTKTRVSGAKDIVRSPCTQHHLRGGQNTPGHTPTPTTHKELL